MASEIQRAILNKIEEYDTIMLFRHIRMDGDCVGATKGLKRILQLTYPEKRIVLTDGQRSDYLAFLGPDDPAVPDEECRNALAIVIDVSEQTRISNPQYALCRELVKIDHHIEADPFGTLSWIEDWRSSACEMIAAFYEAFQDRLHIDSQAAAFIYTGMVTDSGRFRFEGVNGNTLRLAALMLDQGIDMETLYANLYLIDPKILNFKAYVYQHVRYTENGVAYLYVDREMKQEYSLNTETAGDTISYLEGIRGCLCWLAFIEGDTEADGIRVRLRSRFMTVNELASRHHGGGHACASGATVYSLEEMHALINEADQAVKEYKESHTGWL